MLSDIRHVWTSIFSKQLEAKRRFDSNLANTASLLWHAYKSLPSPSADVNWAGMLSSPPPAISPSSFVLIFIERILTMSRLLRPRSQEFFLVNIKTTTHPRPLSRQGSMPDNIVWARCMWNRSVVERDAIGAGC